MASGDFVTPSDALAVSHLVSSTDDLESFFVVASTTSGWAQSFISIVSFVVSLLTLFLIHGKCG
jgi:hypothetical protein